MTSIATQSSTIIALCTPRGSGAIALIRISGPQAIMVATAISKLSSGNVLTSLPTHTIHHGQVINDAGKTIDEVLFLLMHGPKTFTGEHTVEITCHNNPFIIEQIIEQAIKHGARLAREGEFTQQAFFNKKIDLVQAEAINELIHANTQLALKQSLAQLQGSFSNWITRIEQQLLQTLALSEASFEFIDDELEFGDQMYTQLTELIEDLRVMKKAFNQQTHIRQGIRIAVIGSVNAGKSSLFNTLLHSSRAIVTAIPGTTRDVLEAGTYRYGTYLSLVDTAGLRKTDDVIEQEGIKRSHEQAALADIILLTIDSSRPMEADERAVYEQFMHEYASKIIVVLNKNDLSNQLNKEYMHQGGNLPIDNLPSVSISTITQHQLDVLEKNIEKKITELFSGIASPFLLNQRQYHLLSDLEKKLTAILALLTGPIDYELVSYELKDALEHLSQLSGKTISEQSMDAIFRTFCIGK